jgi:hypothetical protein
VLQLERQVGGCREILVACGGNHMEHVSTQCGKNSEMLILNRVVYLLTTTLQVFKEDIKLNDYHFTCSFIWVREENFLRLFADRVLQEIHYQIIHI